MLLVVLVAAGPAVAVLVNFQVELRRDRDALARGIAVQRAELLAVSLGNILAGARQAMAVLAATDRVEHLRPECGALLDDVRRGAPDYVALAVLRKDGTVVCSSAAEPMPPEVVARLGQPFLTVTGFVTGRYAMLPASGRAMLTFALPFVGAGGAGAVVVGGLDVGRLDAILAGLHQPVGGRLIVADRDGTVLARRPVMPDAVGHSLRRTRALLDAPAGAFVYRDREGATRVVGHVPPGSEPGRLFVVAGFDAGELVGDVDATATRGYVLTALGAACSILLALFVGHRFLRAPAAVLLDAARRWGSGDLTARAAMPGSASGEFAALGVAFNRMAELLQQQRTELQGLNDALELRVADRTRALLDSNNRLQVEIAERELTEANLRQMHKLQAVGQLAGGVAHEFNNLLTAILGSLDLLRKRLPELGPRQLRLLDVATDAVERGSKLTGQLLTFSREQPLVAVSVDVSVAITGMAGLLTRSLGPGIRLETRLEPDLWPTVLDPNQFDAAILNLALNARDAMPGGGRLLIAATNLTATDDSAWSELPPGDYVSVTVSDTGKGMSDDVASRAFEPFFTTKAPGEGAGLGLSQVHGMVRQSGGSVSIQSRPGGTKVTMLLPRGEANRPEHTDGGDATMPALGRDDLVLLVDDDEQVRMVTEAALVNAGYTVVTADNGAAALHRMERDGDRIRLVVADHAMPGMTGRALLQTVKQQWPATAILLATGYADYPDLISPELPIDQIVRKPFRSHELLARIRMVIRRQNELARAEQAVGGE